MNLNIIKKIILSLLFYFSLSVGIISCSANKSNLEIKEEIVSDLIPSIKAVAALGKLSPEGEIRELAAPLSQFGSYPRITQLLVKEGDFVKKGDIIAIFENREKLLVDLEKIENLIESINNEISLKEDQIKRYQLALDEDAYSFVKLSQRKDELLKLQKQK